MPALRARAIARVNAAINAAAGASLHADLVDLIATGGDAIKAREARRLAMIDEINSEVIPDKIESIALQIEKEQKQWHLATFTQPA